MALPLKSGADLYNNQALRLRLHNLGADPTEVGAGLIYFNTSTGLNTSQKARLYTGSAWKTIAFSEDLDVASNADFLALKDKVDTLIGDGVDMDGIIESWKEVEAFLSGMSDTKSLMDLLNGKLDKTGGTINGNLNVNGDITTKQYLRITAWEGYGTGEAKVWFNGDSKEVQWQDVASMRIGNNTILTSEGGTLTGLLLLQYTNPRIAFKSDANTTLGAVGFKDGVLSANITADNKWYTLLHSGNVGEYAAGALVAQSTNNLDNAKNQSIFSGTYQAHSCPATNYATGITFYNTTVKYKHQLAFDTDNRLYARTNNTTDWSDWKTIAFTDSDITGNASTATALKTATGFVYAKSFNSDKIVCIGADATYQGYKTYIDGVSIALRYGDGNLTGILLNSSGNVTIGGNDLAGTDAKLYVNGITKAGALELGNIITLNRGYNSDAILDSTKSALKIETYPSYVGFNVYTSGGTTRTSTLVLSDSGNVLIGTADDDGSNRLQVNGGIGTSGEVYLNHNKSIRLKGSNGTDYNVLFTSGTDLQIGYDSPVIRFGGVKMFIDSSGKVGIGTTNPQSTLDVSGNASIRDELYIRNASYSTSGSGSFLIRYYNGVLQFNSRTADGALKSYPLIINYDTDEATFNGDLHVKGNIIADGEVSAGGATEEGGNAGGGGAFHSDIIKEGATQTTIAHGLGTDDIVVSIYEKDGVSGRWSIILTDVEIVDANNIIVSFGSATNVEHKVVIMGAVA